MLDKYFNYFYFLMTYAYNIKRKSKKKNLHIYRFEKVILIALNDYENRRCLIFFFEKRTKLIHRVAYHGYYVRELRRKLVRQIDKINQSDDFFKEEFMKRRSYNYRQERSLKNLRRKQYNSK